MSTTKKYTDEQWGFIKAYEARDPVFAEFLTRYKEHQAKYRQPDCDMTPADIRRLEQDMGDGRRLSADDAWGIIDFNLLVEQDELLHSDDLRKRAEAAWRARPIQRVKAAFRGFLREIRLPA